MKNWKHLIIEEEVTKLIEASDLKPQIIFKDSVTCGRSAYAKEKLIEGAEHLTPHADFHYLDLLSYRNVSDFVAANLAVNHQSPQIIVLKNKKVIYHVSHEAIEPVKIAAHLSIAY